MLKNAISNMLKRIKPIAHCRNAVMLKRRYPFESPLMGLAEGFEPRLTVQQQVYDELEDTTILSDLIEVLLTQDVPGLGTTGTVVSVHRNRFWRYLHPLRMAELPSAERIAHFQSLPTSPGILCGSAFESQQRLANMTLYIPMSSSSDWTLTATNVKVAFRKYGIVVDEKSIHLPATPVTRNSSDSAFVVRVLINDIVDVLVDCRIFYYQKLDKFTCTQPPTNVFKPIMLDVWTEDFPESELRLPV